ncbi:thioredoxin domain-containing protein [Limibacter armeniacum]|uniref:thioredoxin family protein n=1 Tax=Limibacter armeniacum TaxID=466084 RepID=UPI002FE60278
MMKRVLVFICLFICIQSTVHAQGIHFEKISLEDAMAKAKAENKLVFIDFYTVWCGPCKILAKQVFPLESVGKLYNREFVSIKLDAEKEGKAAAKKYDVYSYPTLLFVDGDGKAVYKDTGSMGVDDFIALGKKAVESVNSEYSLEKLQALYPEKQNDERFLKVYFKKMIEYGQDPSDGIEKWLAVQTEIKENDVDMMEFLMNNRKHLLVAGKAEEILDANMEEYMDIATKSEERILRYMKGIMAKNTRDKAVEDKDAELMGVFLENWKKLPSNLKKEENLIDHELTYLVLAKDYKAYKAKAVEHIESLISAKSIEEIQKSDKETYEKYKASYEAHPTAMGAINLKIYEEGVEAIAIIKEICKRGQQYLFMVEGKKDYKVLQGWVKYGNELSANHYLLLNLEAQILVKRGKMDEAIEMKKAALEKWPSSDKKRPTIEYELEQMIKKQA